MKTCIRRGVPRCLRQDGWWLDPITFAGPTPDRLHAVPTPRRYALHALVLAGLIAIAQVPGLSDATEMHPATHKATCAGGAFLHFHATDALRSLPAAPQQGTPL